MEYEFTSIEYEKDIIELTAEIESVEVLPPEEEKGIPKFTVFCLGLLCMLALGTGIWHWYTTYYLEADIFVAGTRGEYIITDEPEPEVVYHEEPIIHEPGFVRPVLDVRPEFIGIRERTGNEQIIGHLFIENTDLDIFVVQVDNTDLSETDLGFFDHRLDVWFDFELNIIIHGNQGSILQSILHEYFSYDFFLMNPIIHFNTIYANYRFEIFAFYVAPMEFPFADIHRDTDTWGDIVELFTLAALYNTMLDVTEFDQVLTLFTPTSTTSGLYYVLQARLYRYITS